MGFSRQEYWNGLPFPPPGNLLDPEDWIQLGLNPNVLSLMHWQARSLPLVPSGKPGIWERDIDLRKNFINTQYY